MKLLNLLNMLSEDEPQGELSLTTEPSNPRPTSPTDLMNDQNFKSWFRKSQVVDKSGMPMVVYHGTKQAFDQFSKPEDGRIPSNTFYFAGNPERAATYAGQTRLGMGHDSDELRYETGANLVPVYLSLQKPMRVNARGDSWNDIYINDDVYTTNDLARIAKEKGHDGLIITNVIDDGAFTSAGQRKPSAIYVAFSPNQIKSIFNTGHWDRAKPEMSEDDKGFTGNTGMENSPQFKRWFAGSKVIDEQGNPIVLYHGTNSDISVFHGVTWGSVNIELANNYAEMRQYSKDNYDGVGNAGANVIPIYMSLKNLFDADLGLTSTVTIPRLIAAMYEQSKANGSNPNPDKLKALSDELRYIASREECGPYYGRHDFWQYGHSFFGKDGVKIIKDIFAVCGFDGIKMLEHDTLTYGALSPHSVKSVFNRGDWDSKNPNLSD